MKVRWTDASLRLRITPTELAALEGGETVRARLSFPGGAWAVALLPQSSVSDLRWTDGEAQLLLSTEDGQRLSHPEVEGVYFETDPPDSLRFFVEKDFPCAHPSAAEAREPVTEAFAPPPDFEARKQERDVT